MSSGIYPKVTLAQARAKKDKVRSQLASGQDLGEAKKDQKLQDRLRRGNTFEVLALDFMAKEATKGRAAATKTKNKAKTKTKTKTKNEWLLSMAIDSFGQKSITEVTSALILTCLRKAERRGTHETAKRLRSKIGAVFSYAIANALAESDPTAALKGARIRPTVKPRAAITEPKKLGGLLRVIDVFQGQTITRLALSLLMILVPRPVELLHALWPEFDLETKVWSIPAARMKMRRPHQVPLPTQAIVLLQELRELNGSSEFLLPSIRSPKRPMSENTMNADLRIMGFTGDEVHPMGFEPPSRPSPTKVTSGTRMQSSGHWHISKVIKCAVPMPAASSGMTDCVQTLTKGVVANDPSPGAKLFQDNCAACHGADAKGLKDIGAHNLTDADWIYGGDAASVHKTLMHGRQGKMRTWAGRRWPFRGLCHGDKPVLHPHAAGAADRCLDGLWHQLRHDDAKPARCSALGGHGELGLCILCDNRPLGVDRDLSSAGLWYLACLGRLAPRTEG